MNMAKNEASRQGLTQEKIDEVDSQLIRRHATGESARYIAEALHLTVCQVQYRIKQLRAEGRIAPSEPPRGWTQEEIDEIIRFAREGMTAREIAVETGIAENSVSAKLYRLRKAGRLPQVGRGRRKSKETEAADEEMAALMARFSAACEVIKEATGYGR